MKSDKYWNERFEQLKKSQLKRTDSFLDDMHDLNKRMKKDISDDVTLWYQRVATANGISMADAKKLMSKKDREEFQWTLEQYEQEAKASLLTGGFSNKVINASANWHLNYLESIDLQLEHHADKMFKGVHDKTTDFLKDSIKESYTETAFELQKGMGKGFTMEVPYDEHKLENILRSPWASDGKNFSSRIWKRKDKLVNELKKNLSESVIRGDSDTEAIKALSIDADKAEFNTRRIIETESAFFDSESERQCCEDFGIEKYRYLAVLDLKTSDICQELDNKVFLEKERQIGVNAPPMHPFCRSTTAPVVDEEFLTSRRAKNIKTGEYDEIPADMNYKEWKAKYVDGKENAEQIKAESSTGTGASGAKIELEPQKVESKYTETPIPQREEKFDSKAYEERVNKRAKKQAVEPATIETERPINYGNTEKVYSETAISKEVKERRVELDEKANKYLEKIKKNDSIPKDVVKETENLINELRENRNNIVKDFEKISGNILLFRIGKENSNSMPIEQLNRICNAFKKQGGIIQIDDNSEAYLNYRGGEGVTYNEKLILLKKNPGRAAVFEELIHSTQYRKQKMDSDHLIECEIEAQKKLLKNSKAYKLSQQEILQTQKALKYYQEQLKSKNDI